MSQKIPAIQLWQTPPTAQKKVSQKKSVDMSNANEGFSDGDIIDAIKNGGQKRERVLHYLYQHHFTFITAVVFNGKEADKCDIFQETLLVLLHNVKKDHFKLTTGLKFYLRQIAKNIWLRQIGRSKKYDAKIALQSLENDLSIDIDLPKVEKVVMDAVTACKANLNKTEKKVFELKYFLRCRGTEIAERLELASHNSASAILNRATKKVLKCLELKGFRRFWDF